MPLLNRYLLTIFSIILTAFLIMGVYLGTLPGFVHNKLKFSNLVVGVIIGLPYVATLFTRHLAGRSADGKGGKITLSIGLAISALAAVCCLLAVYLSGHELASLIVLAASRLLLGVGESFLVVGIFSWGFILVGRENSSKVMVWNGLGMHGGMACGAPIGILLNEHSGINITFASILILPLLSYLLTLKLPVIPHQPSARQLPFHQAVRLIWRSGTGMALGITGFGCIASFITLYFLSRGWANVSFALTSFGACYIVTRLLFSHLPDRYGGARVAIACFLLEITGQILIWLAPVGSVAIAGVVLTGCGASLVFPSFGKVAIRNIPVANQGMAMAAYNAFFDLGVGLTAPVAGLIAVWTNYQSIYLFGGLAATIGLFFAVQQYGQETGPHLTQPYAMDNR